MSLSKSMRLKSLQWYDAKDKRKKRKADLPDMSLIVILQFLTVTLSVKKKKKLFRKPLIPWHASDRHQCQHLLSLYWRAEVYLLTKRSDWIPPVLEWIHSTNEIRTFLLSYTKILFCVFYFVYYCLQTQFTAVSPVSILKALTLTTVELLSQQQFD